jgi:hypothetical protein
VTLTDDAVLFNLWVPTPEQVSRHRILWAQALTAGLQESDLIKIILTAGIAESLQAVSPFLAGLVEGEDLLVGDIIIIDLLDFDGFDQGVCLILVWCDALCPKEEKVVWLDTDWSGRFS